MQPSCVRLDALRPGDFIFRRSLVVALGLLGCVLPVEVGVADPRDELDTQAFLLAASLVGLNEGIAAAEAAYRRAASAGARAVADHSLACLEAGDLLGVIG